MSNQQLEEMQQELFDRKMASELGISYDELLELEYKTSMDEGHDGSIHECIVEFSENSPKEILNKIKGPENGYYVHLGPQIYDEDPSDFEES